MTKSVEQEAVERYPTAIIHDAPIEATWAEVIKQLRAAYLAGYAKAKAEKREVMKSALCVLCATKFAQSWSDLMIKDFDHAIKGLRAALADQADAGKGG